MANNLFESYLTEKAACVDELLQEPFMSATHADMMRYLYTPLSNYTENGGKRHRPLICILACQAVGGEPEQAYVAAAAIEHFHTAALIHDDIADESELRRGMPCMHIALGEGLAINAGDLALSLLTSMVLGDATMSDSTKLRVLGEFVNMAARTVEGQALDIGWAREGRFDITLDDYLTMASHKTAFYSGGVPLAVGAIVGGGSEEQIEALRTYGMNTGLAFQIHDDLLNLIGGKEKVAKDFRSDITEGKRTIIAVHALANTQGALHDELLSLLASKATDPAQLERAVQIMGEAGSLEFARTYATDLVHEHQQIIKDALPSSIYRDLLLSMGDFFVSRIK